MNLDLGAPQSELGRAAPRSGTFPAAFRFLAQTNDGKNRPSETLDHLGDGELIRIDRELIAPHPPPTTVDDPMLSEVEQDDREEFWGNAFTFCELSDRKPSRTRASDAGERPDAVGGLAIEHL